MVYCTCPLKEVWFHCIIIGWDTINTSVNNNYIIIYVSLAIIDLTWHIIIIIIIVAPSIHETKHFEGELINDM